MINKLLRSISRVIFHLSRFLLSFLEAVAPRLFMVFYTRLLKLYGLKFNGKPRYIATKVKFDNFDKVELGERAVISQNVIFLTHDYSFTAGLISIGKCPPTDIAFIRPICVGNNVFIGMSAILLPGTQIGNDVIIGAGSIVRGIIPSDSIVMGNPGKVIGKLSEKAALWEKKMNDIEMSVE